MTGAVLAVVLIAQVPRLAGQALQFVTGITWFLVDLPFLLRNIDCQ